MGKVTISSKLQDEEWKQRQIPFTYASEQYLGNLSKLYQCFIERNMYHYTRLHEYSLLKRFQYKRFPLPIPHVNRRPKGRPGDLRTAHPNAGKGDRELGKPGRGRSAAPPPRTSPLPGSSVPPPPAPGFSKWKQTRPRPAPGGRREKGTAPWGASQPARRKFPQAESARVFPFPSDFLPAHFRSPAN